MDSELMATLEQAGEDRFPASFSAACEVMECLSHSEGSETLLVRSRAGGRLFVAKCYDVGHPLFAFEEPTVLKQLRYSGLPSFIGEYRSDTMRCVLREYIEGVTLDRLAAHERLSTGQIRAIGIRLCEVLNYLHSRNPPVIHRDIKPQNVILTDEGDVVLIDFGISRLYSQDAKVDAVVFGTQAFSPPEQYGFSQTDCRSDIFSLGMLLRWLLTGKIDGEELSGALGRVINRCTAFAPKDRYASAASVKRALQESAPGFKLWRILKVVAVICSIALCAGVIMYCCFSI